MAFDGELDDVMLFDKVLSMEEISFLYSYPNCPHFCSLCELVDGRQQCKVCRGDRIKIGNLCKCSDNQYDDFISENCLGIKFIIKI